MFSKLGFFRFIADYNKPIESLEAAIKAHGDVCGSLIVLPEAFNLGKYYRDVGDCDHHPEILDELQAIAASFHVTLVAGLILEGPDGPTPPFSSVYLIGRSDSTLMCRKNGDDGYSMYTPFKGDPIPQNPVQCGGSSTAAIICMDCDNPAVSRRIKAELAKVDGPKIVCIPACMSSVYGDHAIAESWPNHYVILANSDPNGCRSFISKNGTILERDNREQGNKIILCAP
jgi:predicted amidohydrolase